MLLIRIEEASKSERIDGCAVAVSREKRFWAHDDILSPSGNQKESGVDRENVV